MRRDKEAQRILFDTYWSPRGWKRNQSPDPVEFAYARQAGYMFDVVELTHDDIVERLLSARGHLSLEEVADAFVASLSTRRLDLRSALGSFAFATHFPNHQLGGKTSERVPSGRLYCRVCGHCSFDWGEKQDLNVLSFERLKWGGVRHLDPLYCFFDLAQFKIADQLVPTEEDYSILTGIMRIAASLAPKARPNVLEKAIANVVRSNSSERRVLIDILAFCGILRPSGRTGFLQAFASVEHINRDRPQESKNDWHYPAVWWRGADGVNSEALVRCFPKIAEMF